MTSSIYRYVPRIPNNPLKIKLFRKCTGPACYSLFNFRFFFDRHDEKCAVLKYQQQCGECSRRTAVNKTHMTKPDAYFNL